MVDLVYDQLEDVLIFSVPVWQNVLCVATGTWTLIHFDVLIYQKNIQVQVTGYYYQYIASNDLLTSVSVCQLSKHSIFNGQHPVLSL